MISALVPSLDLNPIGSATLLRSLLCRFTTLRLIADFLLNFALPFTGQPGSQKSVQQIGHEKQGRHPFVIHHCENEDDSDDKKTRNRSFCSPIKRLKARITETAEHHEGEKQHKRRQHEFPFAEMMFAFRQPEH